MGDVNLLIRKENQMGKKNSLKKFDLKRFILINIGVLILASGMYFFLIPANLAV